MSVVIFAWGNPSRGDDAVGPWFANRLREQVCADVIVIEDFQLQVEHLLDCQNGKLLLFIDAGMHTHNAVDFSPVVIEQDIGHTSHALTPAQLLGQYRRLFGTAPPPAFQLVVAGEDFALGHPMSYATQQNCHLAAQLVQDLLTNADAQSWMAHCNTGINTRIENCHA
jgi:hydrogenase maturation protease